jgi:hypothetical protein
MQAKAAEDIKEATLVYLDGNGEVRPVPITERRFIWVPRLIESPKRKEWYAVRIPEDKSDRKSPVLMAGPFSTEKEAQDECNLRGPDDRAIIEQAKQVCKWIGWMRQSDGPAVWGAKQDVAKLKDMIQKATGKEIEEYT